MKKTLVILAAGMGSRFGGPKQFYPVGDNGEFIMDYSIYSAIRYGFTKVVFVIRKEFEDELNNTVIKRINRYIDCSYVFQETSNLPKGLKVPKERTKPLGTAHAMYCARNEVVGNVAVISADDFYGDEAFKDLSESLDRNEYGVLSFKISETMSSHGIVKRGVCITDGKYINDIIESKCEFVDGKVNCQPLDENKKPFKMEKDGAVSMLMYGFTQDIFDSINNEIISAFNDNNDLLTFEIYLPNVIAKEIKNGRKVLNVKTESKWVGLTYKDDVPELQKVIKNYIKKGIYPKNLWSK